MMRDELESGGRVFVVYPVIEVSEELPELRAAESEFETLTNEFKDFQCGLVHGRMKVDKLSFRFVVDILVQYSCQFII